MCKLCHLLGHQLCFPTPAVQISITNISPWLTPCFLSEEALISLYTCADRPKILKLELCMNVHLCVCMKVSPHAYVCMHECVRAVKEYPQRSSKFFSLLLALAALQDDTVCCRHLQGLRLCFAPPLFCFVSVLMPYKANKVTDTELWG